MSESFQGFANSGAGAWTAVLFRSTVLVTTLYQRSFLPCLSPTLLNLEETINRRLEHLAPRLELGQAQNFPRGRAVQFRDGTIVDFLGRELGKTGCEGGTSGLEVFNGLQGTPSAQLEGLSSFASSSVEVKELTSSQVNPPPQRRNL